MSESKKKTEKELLKELMEKREALRSSRFGMKGTKVKNVKESLNIRKEIARILTELRARELTNG